MNTEPKELRGLEWRVGFLEAASLFPVSELWIGMERCQINKWQQLPGGFKAEMLSGLPAPGRQNFPSRRPGRKDPVHTSTVTGDLRGHATEAGQRGAGTVT